VPEVGGLGVVDLAERSVRSFLRHGMATHAAALAYRGLFALFPFAVFFIALIGVLRVDVVYGWLTEGAPNGLAAPLPEPVRSFFDQVQEQSRGGLVWAAVAVALWSVSVGARWLSRALNAVFEVEERRSRLKRTLYSAVFAPALALVVIAAVGLMLITSRVLTYLASWIWLDYLFVLLWTWLRVPVALVLLAVVVALVYRFAADVSLSLRDVAPGAAVAVTLWALASLLFSLALSFFPDLGVAYGSIGAAIALLFYLYVSATVVLFGAEVNAEILRSAKAEGLEKPLSGPERPS
jgi:membrane protein